MANKIFIQKLQFSKKVELLKIRKNTIIKTLKGINLIDEIYSEYSGIFYSSKNGMEIINKILFKNKKFNLNKFSKKNIFDLFKILIEKKINIRAVDVSGLWSEMDSLNDIKSFVFKGKANTLQFLEKSDDC